MLSRANTSKTTRDCARILRLLDGISEFPSDNDDDDPRPSSHQRSAPKRRHVCPNTAATSSRTTTTTTNDGRLLERIPPPFRLHELDDSNPFESLTDPLFAHRYIFDKSTAWYILGLIEYGLMKPSNRGHPVTPIMQLLVTLRFLATGNHASSKRNVDQPIT